MPRSIRLFLYAITLVVACLRPAAPDVVRRRLAPGVEYLQETRGAGTGPLLINVLRVDPKAPGVKIQTAKACEVMLNDEPAHGRESVGALAARHGALAAINGDFFPYTSCPVSLAIRDGELLHESLPYRVAMGLTADGQVRFDTLLTLGSLMGSDGTVADVDGINRPAGKNEIVILTPVFGARTRADASTAVATLANVNLPVRVGQDQMGVAGPVGAGDPNGAIPDGGAVIVGEGRGAEWVRAHVHTGDTIRFRFDCVSNPLPAGPFHRELASRAGLAHARAHKSVWTDIAQAVGGGPWLVRDGKMLVDGLEEDLPERDFTLSRHPRTAVGVTASGELLLVTVDGRQAGLSRGMSLPELAEYLLKLGAVQAINLDGGGSTTMVVRDAYVNSPSDHEPNAIADALLVYADAAAPEDWDTGDLVTLRAGERVTVPRPPSAEGAADASQPTDEVWGTLEGRAFVSQQGVLTSTVAGPGTVVYRHGSRMVLIPFTVIAGPPARLRGSLQPADNNPPDRNQLAIRVTDVYGNPVAGQTVHIQVSGGTAEKADAMTDDRGRIAVEIVWDVDKGRSAVVSCAGVTPITVTGK